MRLYVVQVYDEVAGVYDSEDKATERTKEIEESWGHPPTVSWEIVTLNEKVETLYDRTDGE